MKVGDMVEVRGRDIPVMGEKLRGIIKEIHDNGIVGLDMSWDLQHDRVWFYASCNLHVITVLDRLAEL